MVTDFVEERTQSLNCFCCCAETGKPRREDEILEADGTAAVGAKVQNQRILINKEMPVVRLSSVAAENAGSLSINPATPAKAVRFYTIHLFAIP